MSWIRMVSVCLIALRLTGGFFPCHGQTEETELLLVRQRYGNNYERGRSSVAKAWCRANNRISTRFPGPERRTHSTFAYSALASIRIGTSESASFHRVRKS